ncbi:MAG: ETC complex I subunit [Hyphomonadaceae bacterium]|nr:ETC complex I subunit [Hyphomonadaceae bacterium]
MLARIYRPAKTAMQSGRAKSQVWVLEFERGAVAPETLMGWQSTADTASQVRLTFASREDAIAFARRNAIPHQVIEPREARRIPRAYADNFAFGRREPWSH